MRKTSPRLIKISAPPALSRTTLSRTFVMPELNLLTATRESSKRLFVVPTISFRLLYGLLILQHDRRQILWLGVTAHPTAAPAHRGLWSESSAAINYS